MPGSTKCGVLAQRKTRVSQKWAVIAKTFGAFLLILPQDFFTKTIFHMKKLTLLTTVFVFVAALALNAQTTKGTTMLSLHNFAPLIAEGSGILAPTNVFGISHITSKSSFDGEESDGKSTATTVGLSGSAHYFLADNLSGGINLNFFSQKLKYEYDGDSETEKLSLVMAGPELRYYVPAGGKAKVWFGGSGAFGSIKYDGDDDTSKISRFNGGVGLAYFPNSTISIDFGLGYGTFIIKEDEFKNTNSGLSLDVGFSIFL